MKRGPAPPALARAFDGAVTRLRGIERRKMFGYPAIFVTGHMVAGLVRDRMVLRLGERDRARFLTIRGAEPFVTMGRVMKQWVVVPPVLARSGGTLGPWLRRALAHDRGLPQKAGRRPTSSGRSRRPSAPRTRRACRRGRN